MTGRRTIIGLCMLAMLAFSAVAAQSAMAATGTTAFTCKVPSGSDVPVGTPFNKAHCKDADTDAKGTFRHVEIKEGTTTDITGTNEKTGPETNEASITRLHSIISGVEVELSATGVHGEGTMVNEKTAEGEHFARGSGQIHYTGVEVTKPAGKGCKAYSKKPSEGGVEKTITTNELTATTKGQGDRLQFNPPASGIFVEFYVEGCSIAALNGPYKVEGSIKGTPDGATTKFGRTETTEQKTLKLRGQNAGIEGELTISGKDTTAGDPEFTPLSVTTVTT